MTLSPSLLLLSSLALGRFGRRMGQPLVSAYVLILTTAAPRLSSTPNRSTFNFPLRALEYLAIDRRAIVMLKWSACIYASANISFLWTRVWFWFGKEMRVNMRLLVRWEMRRVLMNRIPDSFNWFSLSSRDSLSLIPYILMSLQVWALSEEINQWVT
jgi:hypothetical protein